MKFKKGDKVIVIAGKDKGKKTTIERLYAKEGKVLLAQANMFKRHVKKGQEYPQGAIIDVARPVQISNIMLLCPDTGKPTRIGVEREDGRKVRVSKQSGKQIK